MKFRKSLLVLASSVILSGCAALPSSSETSNSGSASDQQPSQDEVIFSSVSLQLKDGLPYLSVFGTIPDIIDFYNPYLRIDNTQNDSTDSITQELIIHDYDFSVVIDLSNLRKKGSWYNIFLVFDASAPTQKYEINADSLSEIEFNNSILYPTGIIGEDTIYRKYYFETWDGFLKVLFETRDNKVTSFYSLNYETQISEKENGLYVVLKGIDQHENGVFKLTYGSSEYISYPLFSKDNVFTVSLRVDSFLFQTMKYQVSYEYQLADGSTVKERIGNKNLSDYRGIHGFCYQQELYVFSAEKVGSWVYYNASHNIDDFAMDHLALVVDEGIFLEFSGVAKMYWNSGMSLAISKGKQGTSDFSYSLNPLAIDSTGYIQALVPLTDLDEINYPSNEIGLLKLYNQQLFLGEFWSEWTHFYDNLGPVNYGSYTYEIVKNSDSSYSISKKMVS